MQTSRVTVTRLLDSVVYFHLIVLGKFIICPLSSTIYTINLLKCRNIMYFVKREREERREKLICGWYSVLKIPCVIDYENLLQTVAGVGRRWFLIDACVWTDSFVTRQLRNPEPLLTFCWSLGTGIGKGHDLTYCKGINLCGQVLTGFHVGMKVISPCFSRCCQSSSSPDNSPAFKPRPRGVWVVEVLTFRLISHGSRVIGFCSLVAHFKLV